LQRKRTFGHAPWECAICAIQIRNTEEAKSCLRTVSFVPLPVVDQTPVDVAFDVDALQLGPSDLRQVRDDVGGAVALARLWHAVLGDDDRQLGVVIVQPSEQAIQAMRIDLPAKVIQELVLRFVLSFRI